MSDKRVEAAWEAVIDCEHGSMCYRNATDAEETGMRVLEAADAADDGYVRVRRDLLDSVSTLLWLHGEDEAAAAIRKRYLNG